MINHRIKMLTENEYRYLTDEDLTQLRLLAAGFEGLRHPMSKEQYFINVDESLIQHMIQEIVAAVDSESEDAVIAQDAIEWEI